MFNFTPGQRNALILLSSCLAVLLVTAAFLRLLRSGDPAHVLLIQPTPMELPAAEASASPEELLAKRGVVLRPLLTEATPSRRPLTLPLDINAASVGQLQALPGLGPALAARIVSYRNTHGPFQTVEGLLQVHGIGRRTLEKVRPFLVCRGG